MVFSQFVFWFCEQLPLTTFTHGAIADGIAELLDDYMYLYWNTMEQSNHSLASSLNYRVLEYWSFKPSSGRENLNRTISHPSVTQSY